MGILQDINRFKKMIDLEKKAQESNSLWKGKDGISLELYRKMLEKRYNLMSNLRNEEYKSGYLETRNEPNEVYLKYWNECVDNGGGNVECSDEAFKKISPPSGEEVQMDPQMYLDHPYLMIQDAAKKLINGED